jgi:hypothetical protein
MNAERSMKRAWVREVAIGLGRPLTRREQREVEAEWRRYRRSVPALHFTVLFPRDFVAKFSANKEAK